MILADVFRFVTALALVQVVVEEPVQIEAYPAEGKVNGSVDCELSVPADLAFNGVRTPVEEGAVRFSCDNDNLILDVFFNDSDIIAQGEADQLQHNELGDVLEIFLKPPGKPYYWELFVTPSGHQSSLFWNRTVSMEWDKTPEKRIHLGIKINPQELPQGWTASVRIPFCDLMKMGDLSPAEVPWKILVARQNYTGSVRKDCRELSSFPPLDKTNFHATDCFAELYFEKEIMK